MSNNPFKPTTASEEKPKPADAPPKQRRLPRIRRSKFVNGDNFTGNSDGSLRERQSTRPTRVW